MRKSIIFVSAVFVLMLCASLAQAEQILPGRFEWYHGTEADTIGKNNADSSPVVAYTYGSAIIVNRIEIQGYNKAGQSDSDIELVIYALVYGDSGPIHTSATYASGAKVIDSYQVKAYGDSDMYLSQSIDFATDFSELKEGGKRLAENEAVIFAVQVKDGNYYSSLPGTTDLQVTVKVWYRLSTDKEVLKHTK